MLHTFPCIQCVCVYKEQAAGSQANIMWVIGPVVADGKQVRQLKQPSLSRHVGLFRNTVLLPVSALHLS